MKNFLRKKGKNSMKCKNKQVTVKGIRYDGNEEFKVDTVDFECIVTNDDKGKTLSLCDGHLMFTIPFEELEEWLK